MKTLVVLIFLCLSLTTQAQTWVYHPFPDSNAVWNITRYGGLISCGGKNFIEKFSYVFSGDTVIKGNTYHKLFIPSVKKQDTCAWWHTNSGYAGALRQDVAAKKVFYILPGDTVQDVLYDFNLKVGDVSTPPTNLPCNTIQDTVKKIDSVLVGTNYRKRWSTSISFNMFIEGIGSTSGLLPCGYMPDGDLWQLTCFKQGEVLIYPSSATSCDIIEAVQNVPVKSVSVFLSSNPFHSTATLFISDFDFANYDLKIYDAVGRLVRMERISNQSTIIHRNSLADGIYFYQLISEGGQVGRGKFVVE